MIFSRITSILQWLKLDPISAFTYIIFFTISLLTTLIIHEYAHAFIAYKCGDPTAKMLGRLTLNPAKHLDPLGTISMVLFGFGWAKPVPINPNNFKERIRDDFFVSIAGILVNLTMFISATALMVAINRFVWNDSIITSLGSKALLTSDSMGNNIILYSSLRENSIFFNSLFFANIQKFLMIFSKLNLVIAIFNFLPIPPLDGFHIFNNLFFKGKFYLDSQKMNIANLVLMVLVFTGTLNKILIFFSSNIEKAVINIFLIISGSN